MQLRISEFAQYFEKNPESEAHDVNYRKAHKERLGVIFAYQKTLSRRRPEKENKLRKHYSRPDKSALKSDEKTKKGRHKQKPYRAETFGAAENYKVIEKNHYIKREPDERDADFVFEKKIRDYRLDERAYRKRRRNENQNPLV
jgi:hypothetical protein